VKKIIIYLAATALIVPITFARCNKAEKQEAQLKRDVEIIASVIGARCPQKHANLEKTASYIHSRLDHLLPHTEQKYILHGKPYRNLIFENTGKNKLLPAIIIGAHYDSAPTPQSSPTKRIGVLPLNGIMP
jgi:hypothetical protein